MKRRLPRHRQSIQHTKGRFAVKCKLVQRELSVIASDVMPTNDAIKRHLETCTACADFRRHLQRLESHLANWDHGWPPPALERGIASALAAETSARMAAHTGQSSRPRLSLGRLRENPMMKRLSWGAALLTAGIILAVSLQTGRANSVLKRMGQAARGVQSVHLLGWNCELQPEVAESVEAGETVHSVTDAFPRRYEAWIKDGRWREAQDNAVTVYENGKVWRNGVPSPQEKRP